MDTSVAKGEFDTAARAPQEARANESGATAKSFEKVLSAFAVIGSP
jgi:hypothetical protein